MHGANCLPLHGGEDATDMMQINGPWDHSTQILFASPATETPWISGSETNENILASTVTSVADVLPGFKGELEGLMNDLVSNPAEGILSVHGGPIFVRAWRGGKTTCKFVVLGCTKCHRQTEPLYYGGWGEYPTEALRQMQIFFDPLLQRRRLRSIPRSPLPPGPTISPDLQTTPPAKSPDDTDVSQNSDPDAAMAKRGESWSPWDYTADRPHAAPNRLPAADWPKSDTTWWVKPNSKARCSTPDQSDLAQGRAPGAGHGVHGDLGDWRSNNMATDRGPAPRTSWIGEDSPIGELGGYSNIRTHAQGGHKEEDPLFEWYNTPDVSPTADTPDLRAVLPPEGQAFRDPETQRVWCINTATGNWFYEDNPGQWNKGEDDLGILWRHAVTQETFYIETRSKTAAVDHRQGDEPLRAILGKFGYDGLPPAGSVSFTGTTLQDEC